MKTLISNIKADWGLLRIMRIALAVFFIYDGYMGESFWMIALGGILAYQAIANVGCASCEATGSCSTKAPASAHPADDLEVDYEEVKQ